MSKQSKRKSEFRYHKIIIHYKNGKKKSIRHPTYIWQERGIIYDYHSITHSSSIEGISLKELRTNPNPRDKRKSYYDAQSKSDHKASFGRKRKGWKLHPLDEEEIQKSHKK